MWNKYICSRSRSSVLVSDMLRSPRSNGTRAHCLLPDPEMACFDVQMVNLENFDKRTHITLFDCH